MSIASILNSVDVKISASLPKREVLRLSYHDIAVTKISSVHSECRDDFQSSIHIWMNKNGPTHHVARDGDVDIRDFIIQLKEKFEYGVFRVVHL